MDVRNVLEYIISAQREAGELMLSARAVQGETKSGARDLVTQYDRAVQELLVKRLSAALPSARFFCEENERQDELDAEELFIIDPIDGTMNFVRHFNHSCISVAYAQRGRVLAAAVYNPYVDELFTAIRGEGAFLNGRPIRAEDCALSETVVCCGTSPYRAELTDKTFTLIKKLYEASLDIRRQGSAALDLCSAAAGRAGAYVELSLSLWDYAAGALIVEEAGGLVCRPDGSSLPMDGTKPGVVAGGRRAVKELLALMGDE